MGILFLNWADYAVVSTTNHSFCVVIINVRTTSTWAEIQNFVHSIAKFYSERTLSLSTVNVHLLEHFEFRCFDFLLLNGNSSMRMWKACRCLCVCVYINKYKFSFSRCCYWMHLIAFVLISMIKAIAWAYYLKPLTTHACANDDLKYFKWTLTRSYHAHSDTHSHSTKKTPTHTNWCCSMRHKKWIGKHKHIVSSAVSAPS